MDFTEHTAPNGVVFLTAPGLGGRHGFSTRIGGVSTGSLASLNLGENRGDTPENVRENYRRFAEALGFSTQRMVFTKQVHGSAVRRVTAADTHALFTPVPYEADGIVTGEKGLALVCFTADCVPVLLRDELGRACAAVHCGWRSSVADILKNALEAMGALGAERSRIRAAVGPAISRCCFEVGEEVVSAAKSWLGELDGLLAPGKPGKYYLDLKRANARRLEQLGLDPERIEVSDACTMCRNENFWSHRYTRGDRGSQAAAIWL